MARLIAIPGDPEGRVACSACAEQAPARIDGASVFEYADPARSLEEFYLRGTPPRFEHRLVRPQTWNPWLPVQGPVVCVGCRDVRRDDAEPAREPIYRVFDLVTGLEIEST